MEFMKEANQRKNIKLKEEAEIMIQQINNLDEENENIKNEKEIISKRIETPKKIGKKTEFSLNQLTTKM